MKKILLFPICCFLFLTSSTAQNPGEWMWVHGTNTPSGAASYGTQGIAGPTNVPAASYESCDWTDLNGNFWLYGGTGNNARLWKYDPTTNQWTWMKGNGTTSYGVKGVSSSTNNPPNKSYGAGTWVDNQGNFWVFGGLGGSNDLWKYNPSINEWVWMKGSQTGGTGVYGTRGVPDTANTPGPRSECVAAWTDSLNNLWLFGGYSLYNDLWRYNIATNTWTWMKGSNTTGQAGVYGTKGIEAPANTPGARAVYSHWKDKNENLWLFGGTNMITTSAVALNDLWRYNPVTNNWAWMGGLTTSGAVRNISVGKCISDSTNWPGQKYENRAAWTDQCGNFWMCGGTTDGNFVNVWNDLWMYSPVSNQWTWVSGDTSSNPVPNWGTKNISSPANKMSGRGGSVAWYDKNGHIYVFGGYASNPLATYNDLWKFTIDTNCVNISCSIVGLPVAVFTSSDTTFCNEAGQCISFTDHSAGNPTSWKWLFPGASPDSSLQQNPSNICYYAPGTFPVTLIVTNAGGTDTVTVSPMITLTTSMPVPLLSISHDTIFCTHAAFYQWYFNGSPIGGATDSFYVFTNPGTYSVLAFDGLGCSSLSAGLLITSVSSFIPSSTGLILYPNPAGEEFTIYGLNFKSRAMLEVYNAFGEKVYDRQLEAGTNKPVTVNCKQFASGIYFVRVTDGQDHRIGRIIVE